MIKKCPTCGQEVPETELEKSKKVVKNLLKAQLPKRLLKKIREAQAELERQTFITQEQLDRRAR